MKSKIKADPLDTPVMRQYQELKRKYSHAILFFRMGDFYELFLEDAQKAAPLMEVALTRRQSQIPMAGVPYHSAEIYIKRLLEKGYHVAIAEQEVDPRNSNLMCRRVHRVITPGTVVEEKLLDTLGHNYLMAMVSNHEAYGLALTDISTGDFFAFTLKKHSSEPFDKGEFLQIFHDHYVKFSPREILLPTEFYNELSQVPERKSLIAMEDWKASPLEGRRQIESRYKQSLKGLGYKNERDISLGAVSLILHYMQQNFPSEEFRLGAPVFLSMAKDFMQLDEHSIRNLDIVQNQNEGGTERTLYSVLDLCQTSFGKRFLKERLLLPLLDLKRIRERQRIVKYLIEETELRNAAREELKASSDLERVLARMGTGRGAPRDLLALSMTIQKALKLSKLFQKKTGLASISAPSSGSNGDQEFELIKVAEELVSLSVRIKNEVHPEAPPLLPGKSPFLRSGLYEDLDQAREAGRERESMDSRFRKKKSEKEQAFLVFV